VEDGDGRGRVLGGDGAGVGAGAAAVAGGIGVAGRRHRDRALAGVAVIGGGSRGVVGAIDPGEIGERARGGGDVGGVEAGGVLAEGEGHVRAVVGVAQPAVDDVDRHGRVLGGYGDGVG